MSIPPYQDPGNPSNPSNPHSILWVRAGGNSVAKRVPTIFDWIIFAFVAGLFGAGMFVTILNQ